MKYKIEKNTVQETLILPLYSRKLCTELYPNLYRDETAVRLIDEIDYDFSEAENNFRSLMQRWSIWAAGWIILEDPATMADARSTIWTFPMLSTCGGGFCLPGSGSRTSPAT